MSVLGFRCSACGSRATSTIDSRPKGAFYTRRRRVCKCGHKFTTFEVDSKSFEMLENLGRVKAQLEATVAALSENSERAA